MTLFHCLPSLNILLPEALFSLDAVFSVSSSASMATGLGERYGEMKFKDGRQS